MLQHDDDLAGARPQLAAEGRTMLPVVRAHDELQLKLTELRQENDILTMMLTKANEDIARSAERMALPKGQPTPGQRTSRQAPANAPDRGAQSPNPRRGKKRRRFPQSPAHKALDLVKRILLAVWRRRAWTFPVAVAFLIAVALGLALEPLRQFVPSTAAFALLFGAVIFLTIRTQRLRRQVRELSNALHIGRVRGPKRRSRSS